MSVKNVKSVYIVLIKDHIGPVYIIYNTEDEARKSAKQLGGDAQVYARPYTPLGFFELLAEGNVERIL